MRKDDDMRNIDKNKKLNELIDYVKVNNQFYKKFYENIETPIKNVSKLPILERKMIRENADEIISLGYEKDKLKYDRTNGTTEGNPLEIFKTKSEWISLDFDLWSIRRKIDKDSAQKYAFYYYNGDDFSEPYRYFEAGNRVTLQIAMKKKNEEDFIEDLKRINEYNIKWIIAPPSIIFSLCCIAVKYNIYIKVNIIESISEYLPSFYKKFFEKVLGGKVYIHYSCHEIWGMGFSDDSNKIKIMDRCMISTKKDERFERDFDRCIATNLRIKSMPFINYELSDLVQINDDTIKTFGFRWTEEVRLKNLNIHCSFFDNIFIDFKKLDLRPLENYQIIYKEDEIRICLISKDENLRNEIKEYVQNKIKNEFGKEVCIICELASRFYVDKISGKMRGIIRYEDINWEGWEFHLLNNAAKQYLDEKCI